MNNKRKKRKERNRLGAAAAGAAPSHFFPVRIYLDIHSLPPPLIFSFYFLFSERDHALINGFKSAQSLPFYP